MKNLACVLFVLFSMMVLLSCSDNFKNDFSPPGLIHDRVGMLNVSEVNDITSILEAHNNKGPGKISVITIEELPNGVSIEKYANGLNCAIMNLDDGMQNRILFLISKKDRLIRIETSKDVWDLLTNEECSHIIKEIIAPKLKDEQYFEGIRLGIVAMINELKNTGAQPAAVANR